MWRKFHCYIQLKRKGINAYIFYLWNIEGAVFSIAQQYDKENTWQFVKLHPEKSGLKFFYHAIVRRLQNSCALA
jgi:hypothetical protein